MRTIRDIDKIILASGSPRRKELLEKFGIEFDVMPSSIDEVITREIPWEIVMELSTQKARDIVFKVAMDSISKDKNMDILVIGADTIVANGNSILTKPKDKEDARRMISELSGHAHSVYTGVSMVYLKEGIAQTKAFVDETKVYVADMTSEQIEKYISTDEPYDKAGGYAIQGQFMEYITKIEGDYNNVVGLPIGRILRECIF